VEAGVVNVAVAVWHEHQDIRKTHVPQNLARHRCDERGGLETVSSIPLSVTIIVASAAARVSAVTP